MTRLTVLVAAVAAALVLAANALALGGSVYAQISANWSNSADVKVTVLSNHSFNAGTVNITCANTAVNVSKALTGWTFDSIAHQYRIDSDFDITAAGSGASCTITVTDGHKTLAEQSFVSV